MAGNRRFTTGAMTGHEHDLAILKQYAIEKQEPFAAVLSCADSRVPVELIFDQSIGHLQRGKPAPDQMPSPIEQETSLHRRTIWRRPVHRKSSGEIPTQVPLVDVHVIVSGVKKSSLHSDLV
jgi:hypothetical protein